MSSFSSSTTYDVDKHIYAYTQFLSYFSSKGMFTHTHTHITMKPQLIIIHNHLLAKLTINIHIISPHIFTHIKQLHTSHTHAYFLFIKHT